MSFVLTPAFSAFFRRCLKEGQTLLRARGFFLKDGFRFFESGDEFRSVW